MVKMSKTIKNTKTNCVQFCKKILLLTMYYNNNKQTWKIINDVINHKEMYHLTSHTHLFMKKTLTD